MIFSINDKALRRLGLKVVSRIKQNTREGFDKDGKAFKPYSTRPFAMPSGATTKRALGKLDKDGQITWFKKDNGATWILILGGYLALKKARYPKSHGMPDLTATGAMMRSLGVISFGNGQIKIGFRREEEAEKMLWNIQKGRNPMGLPDEDWDEITEGLTDNDYDFVF